MTMEAGKWYQVGNPFAPLDDTTTVKLNDVFTEGFSTGDIINVFDPTAAAYRICYWNDTINKWAIAQGVPVAADVDLKVGQAVYIHKAMTGEVPFSGKVVTQAVSFGKIDGAAWDQICCLWPAEAGLNDFTWTGMNDGDVLNVLNVEKSAYSVYYWNSAINKWAIAQGVPVAADTVKIAPGQALFLNKVSAGLGSVCK